MSALPLEEDDLAAYLVEDDEDEDQRPTRPALQSGIKLGSHLDDDSFGQRNDLEWRLYHRGRFAPEYHTISLATLKRIDAMYERLPFARSPEETMKLIHDAFVHEDERRAALVPLLGVLYPVAFFDDTIPTADIVRLIAHYERRKPATPL
jgi:hypothetical protein